MPLLPFQISFQGTTWPQHRYDISITHQQQFLQRQQHDNLYNSNNNNNKNHSSTRTTATANGGNFKAIRFCATHKHKANRRQQQQQHYASQHLRQQQHQEQQQQQQQEQHQQQEQQQQQQMMYQPATPGPQMRSLPATETPSTGCDILWPAVLQPAMLLLLFNLLLPRSNTSNAWPILLLLWPLLQGLRSRIASPRALAYHAYLPKSVRTLRNHNESPFNTALQLRRLRQSASSRMCKSLHALYFRWLSSLICCLYSMQVSDASQLNNIY